MGSYGPAVRMDFCRAGLPPLSVHIPSRPLRVHIDSLIMRLSGYQSVEWRGLTICLEIQELRHKSQSAGDASNATTVDQSLATLDERLESVSKGIKVVNDSLEALLTRVEQTPTLVDNFKQEEEATVLRVHAALVADWEAVQKDIQVLREELKEDKWLTVFRTVTDQADGMMSSLEKAVNRCQVRGYLICHQDVDLTCLVGFHVASAETRV